MATHSICSGANALVGLGGRAVLLLSGPHTHLNTCWSTDSPYGGCCCCTACTGYCLIAAARSSLHQSYCCRI